MPLPETAIDYLKYAIKCIKQKGFIHLYCFSEEDKVDEKLQQAAGICKELKVRCKIVANKVLPYGPGIYKYRLDITLSR